MSTNQLKLNVSDVQSTCDFIVAHFSDTVAAGMRPFDAFYLYNNQLQGLLLLVCETAGEGVVVAAKARLRDEYRKVLNGSVSPNASAVQEVA